MSFPCRRSASVAIVTLSAASVVLLVAAMCAYPGGTQWDHASDGNDFWRNYLCDLARTVALNGEPNPTGSALAQASMIAIALGLVPLWWLLPHLFSSRARLGAWVRALGYVSVTGSFAVVLLPADRFSQVHGVAIVLSGVPGLAAGLLGVVGLVRAESAPRIAASFGIAALVAAMVAFVLYVMQFASTGPGPVEAAIFERLALVLLLAWMVAVAWRGAQRTDPSYDRPKGLWTIS